MKRLTFVVPVHGRLGVATVCLRQLRRTCNALRLNASIEAAAVIVADADNLRALEDRIGSELLGFGYVERDNQFLGRRFNDGFQLACDPTVNPSPADYVVPFGSDDWVDWRLLTDLPPERTVYAFQRLAYVREDGREISRRRVGFEGGCGIRIYPRKLLKDCGYRPADPDRYNGCDTSTLVNLKRLHGNRLKVEHRPNDPLQIVDWKTAGEQLHSYASEARSRALAAAADPFRVLRGLYPKAALTEMRSHYGVAA